MKTRLFITLALLASCTILLSFISDAAAGQTADACVNDTTGAIRLLLSGGCNAGENPISLNIEGKVGPVGPKGPAGSKGDKGAPGPQGREGPQGPMGPKGASQGPPGPQGPQGTQGPQGNVGPQGPIGLTGPAGPAGAAGATGATGSPGPQGQKGPQGPSWGTGGGATMPTTIAYGSYQIPANSQSTNSGNNWVLLSAGFISGPYYQVSIGLSTMLNDLVTVPTCIVTCSEDLVSWQLVVDDTIYPGWILQVYTWELSIYMPVNWVPTPAPFSFVCFQ
jgi:hypothetical protein